MQTRWRDGWRTASSQWHPLGMLLVHLPHWAYSGSHLERERKKKENNKGEGATIPNPHLHIYTCRTITGCQRCTQHLLTKSPSLQISMLPLDFTNTVQKDIRIKPCRMRSTAHTRQGFMSAFSLYNSQENVFGEFGFY